MKIISIQIINPDTNAPVSMEDWKKESDPTRAEWILIQSDQVKPFLIHKKVPNKAHSLKFDQAIKAGNALTRARAVIIHEARNTTKINQALLTIGGDLIGGWFWTNEPDTDPNNDGTDAWAVNLDSGKLDTAPKRYSYQMLRINDWTE